LGWIEKELFYGECKYYQRFFQISLLTWKSRLFGPVSLWMTHL
jgi:hypothetical protein